MPARQRSTNAEEGNAAVAANRGSIHSSGASNLHITMPPSMSFHEIKKFQNLFIAMAQITVRAEGTLSVQEQHARMQISFDALISRWFCGDATMLQIYDFPECPQALTSLGTAARVINVLKCTTGTGRVIMDNEAMIARSKDIKKEMLSQTANWNMLCGSSRNDPAYGVPGTGRNKDTIYKELVSLDWRVHQTRKLLKLLLSCQGVQFQHSASCTPDCIRRARESVYFASRGLTRVQQDQIMRARDPASVNLRNQVLAEANAAEELESENTDQSTAAGANRAPAATSAGSRSSFTEQPEPPNYSIEIEHVFKVYGPYAAQVTPFFSELWQQHCQSEYATGRSNVQALRHQERSSVSNSFVNPNAHPQLRMGTVTNSTGSAAQAASSSCANRVEQPFITMVMPFFDRMQREAQDTNYLNARRDEVNELSNALRIFAPGPDGSGLTGVTAETLSAWRSRYIALMNTPMQLPSARLRDETSPNTLMTVPSALPQSAPRQQRQRLSSPARAVVPETSMAMALDDLRTRFTITECGGESQCTFRVLHVIEFTLGSSRRALYNCGEEDDHTHTRSRVANWMRINADTNIIRFDDGSTLSVAQAAAGGREQGQHSDLESYCDWIAQPDACGGETEIACFAAMYNMRITRHSVAHYLNGVAEEVMGLNTDDIAPHHHMLYTPGHYTYLDPIRNVSDDGALADRNSDSPSSHRTCTDISVAMPAFDEGLQSPSAASQATIVVQGV